MAYELVEDSSSPRFELVEQKDRLTPEQRAAVEDLKNRPWGSGVPKFAHELGEKVTDFLTKRGASPEVSAGFGTAANVLTHAVPTMLMSGRMADSNASSLLAGPAKWLMQSSVKPTMAARKSGDAARAMTTMLDEGIYPTQSGIEKASSLVTKLNQQVEQAVANAPSASVSLKAVTGRLKEPYQRSLMQVNPTADINAIRSVADEFLSSPKILEQRALQAQYGPVTPGDVQIPAQLAHELKKGTYASLGGKAYGELGTASTEAQKQLARGLREEVGTAIPEVVAPLKREAGLMNVMDVAGDRVLLDANKNPLGLAALRMDDPRSMAAFMADRWAALKAFLAFQGNALGKPSVMGPATIAGGLYANPDVERLSIQGMLYP